MSKYYSRGNIYAKCDGCGKRELVAENQTDRLLANDYFREHGWKTRKTENGWVNICPDCVSAVYAKRRERWVNSRMEGTT
jgi:hypothetical protein